MDAFESGVKTLEGMVRTLKFHLEDRLDSKIPVDSPIFSWLVEHAADLYTKLKRGEDGMTPYQRLKGKPYHGEVYDFASLVHHHVPGKTQGGLMTRRYVDGVWLGTRFESGEHLVAMSDGRVVKARTIEPFPA